jgi:hypothetical protein
MRHLTPEQLVDLADGVAAESASPHLQSCAACQRQLMDLRAMLSAVADVDAPEPSPLFWDHFAARVHDAVSVLPDTKWTVWRGWRRAAGARLAALVAEPRVIGGLAIVVIAVAIAFQPGRSGPASAPSTSAPVVDAPALTAPIAAPVADDPALSLVTDLAGELDWDSAREAGLTTHVGLDDDDLSQLTSGERGELRRLLQAELSPSRRGA